MRPVMAVVISVTVAFHPIAVDGLAVVRLVVVFVFSVLRWGSVADGAVCYLDALQLMDILGPVFVDVLTRWSQPTKHKVV